MPSQPRRLTPRPRPATLLWAAVRAGDEKAIAAAIEKGADVNARNEYGITALWIAASKGKTEVIELLVARGANPNARDDIWYQTPLSHVARQGGERKSPPQGGAKDVDAAAIAAASQGNTAVLQAVLDTGKVRQEALDAALFRTAESSKEIREALDEGRGEAAARCGREGPRAWKALAGSYESEHGTTMKVEVPETGLVVIGRAQPRALRSRPARMPSRHSAPRRVPSSSNGRERRSRGSSRSGSRRSRTSTRQVRNPSRRSSKPPMEIGGRKVIEPANWPQFRGADASGVADGQDPPITFDVKEETNVLWKTPIPGLGHSCPIVWGDRVFLTTAVGGNTSVVTGNYGNPASVKDDSKHVFQVICLDRLTGKILWTRTAFEGVPKIKRHLKGSHANCTPADRRQAGGRLLRIGGAVLLRPRRQAPVEARPRQRSTRASRSSRNTSGASPPRR